MDIKYNNMAQIIDKQIIDYLPLLVKEEKKTLLSVIKSFMHLKSEPIRISIEQYNKEIEASEIEYEEGNYVTHAEFKEEIRQW